MVTGFSAPVCAMIANGRVQKMRMTDFGRSYLAGGGNLTNDRFGLKSKLNAYTKIAEGARRFSCPHIEAIKS